MMFVMNKDESKLRPVLKKLEMRGIRLQGISGIGGKYLFTDQRGEIYFIRNASLMSHRPANRKAIYKVWMIKLKDTEFDYLVCGLFKDDKLIYVTRAHRSAVNFKATMLMENRIRSRRGWEILYWGR